MNHIAVYLKEIFFGKKTGKLVFRKDTVLRYFFFQDGSIIQVKTSVPEERLGEILFRLHRISKEAHERIDEFIEPNVNIGEVLRRKGVVSEEDLEEALSYQIRETILNCFKYFNAEISFLEHGRFTDKPIQTKINVPFLIEYGIRRMTDVEQLRDFLATKVPFLNNTGFAYLLTQDEKDLLDAVDGKESTQVLSRSLKVSADAFWKTMYLCYCLDIIGLRETTSAGSKRQDSANSSANTDKEETAVSPEEIMEFHKELATKNFYQILGLERGSSQDEVKKAFFRLARKFHPDRFHRDMPPEVKNIVDEIFGTITLAYQTLIDKEKRRVYDQKSITEAATGLQDYVRRAETRFRQARTLYNQGRYEEVIPLLEEAIRLRNDKGDYFLLLGLTESRLPGLLKKAEDDFLKAIALEPWNPEGYVGLGILYKQAGLAIKATNQFKKALDIDSDHEVARQHYEELTGKKTKKPGLFGFSVFGKPKKKT